MQQLDINFEKKSNPHWVDHPFFQEVRPHIVRGFVKFHAENPHIFDLYLKFGRELLLKGRKRYGIGMITERIRWHTAVETTDKDFKISNNHRSCYARLLMIKEPRFQELFRRTRST